MILFRYFSIAKSELGTTANLKSSTLKVSQSPDKITAFSARFQCLTGSQGHDFSVPRPTTKTFDSEFS